MAGLTLLAVGGPKHGEQLPYRDGQTSLNVPSIPPLHVAYERDDVYCVHGGEVISRNDYERHFVPASKVASLYGLRPTEWKAGLDGRFGAFVQYGHLFSKFCIGPRFDGDYNRLNLPPLRSLSDLTIGVARYERRVVSDRAVWLYVGAG